MKRFANAGLIRMSRPSGPKGVMQFRISESSRLFEGHFAGEPVLPGVTHIALALAACAEREVPPGPLRGLRNVRFSRPLRPGDEIEILLTAGREPTSMRFEIRSGGHSATSGLLLFASNGEARE